jgi:hypothetical protein
VAVTLTGSIGFASGTAVTLSGSYGQTPTAGNLLVACVQSSSTTSAGLAFTCSTPAGWTASSIVGLAAANNRCGTAFFWKVAAGADAAPSFTVNTSTTNLQVTVDIYELAGALSATPIDASGTFTSGTTGGTIASVTVTTSGNVTAAGEFAISSMALSKLTSQAITVGDSTGFTVGPNDSASVLREHGASNYLAGPASGATLTDTITVTSDTSSFAVAAMVVIAAAPAISAIVPQPGGRTWRRRRQRRQAYSPAAPASYLNGAYQVTASTDVSGNTVYTVPVQANAPNLPNIPVDEGLALIIALGGAGTPPAVSTVTDGAGNTWTPQQNPTTGTSPHLIVYTCPVTTALVAGTTTLTVTFATATASTPAFLIVGASQRSVIDVSTVLATGNSTQAAVTGTPASGGEVMLGCFAWAFAGGAGLPEAPARRIAQSQTGGGSYATVDYLGGTSPAVPVTITEDIATAAWRGVMITFKPAALLWFTNTTFITSMDTADHSSTSALFSSSRSLGITTDSTGTNPPPSPGSLPGGYSTTPILKYTSYTQLQADVVAGNIPAGYKWLLYDTEDWPDPPGNDTEQQYERADPWTYMSLFTQLGHSLGYRVILTPGRDLGNEPGTVRPILGGEILDDWFVRTGVATAAAACGADVVHIQAQADQATPPTAYTSFWNRCLAQVNAVSGFCRVTAGVSSTSPGGVTATDMFNSATAISSTVQGYWLNTSAGTISVATAFEDLMVGGVSAPAGVAVSTASAVAPVAAVTANAGAAAALASAVAPAKAESATAGVSTASSAAVQPVASVQVFAGVATALALAVQPSVSTTSGLNVPAGVAAASAVASGASIVITANAGIPVALGIAAAPSQAATVTAGVPLALATANAATAAITVNAGVAAAAGTAVRPAISATTTAAVATSLAVAPAPVPAVSVFAGVAAALAVAPPATVSTAAATSAPAGVATGLAVAVSATAAITANAAPATSLGAAPQPVIALTVNASVAVSLAAAPPATVSTVSNVNAPAGVATALAIATAATAAITVNAAPAQALAAVTRPVAAITVNAAVAASLAAAPPATVSTASTTSAPAGVAVSLAVAVAPVPAVAAQPPAAASAGSAPQPVTAITVIAGAATSLAVAPPATVSVVNATSAPAGVAASLAVAAPATLAITASPAAAISAGSAPQPVTAHTVLAAVALALAIAPPATGQASRLAPAGVPTVTAQALSLLPLMTFSAQAATALATAPQPGVIGQPRIVPATGTATVADLHEGSATASDTSEGTMSPAADPREGRSLITEPQQGSSGVSDLNEGAATIH